MRYLKTLLVLLLFATPALAQYGGSYSPVPFSVTGAHSWTGANTFTGGATFNTGAFVAEPLPSFAVGYCTTELLATPSTTVCPKTSGTGSWYSTTLDIGTSWTLTAQKTVQNGTSDGKDNDGDGQTDESDENGYGASTVSGWYGSTPTITLDSTRTLSGLLREAKLVLSPNAGTEAVITATTAGTTTSTYTFGSSNAILATPTVTLGNSSSFDTISITPVAKGSTSYDGLITSSDLTAARTWTLPNATGTVALLGSSNNNVSSTNFPFYGTGTVPGSVTFNIVDTDGTSWDTSQSSAITYIHNYGIKVDINRDLVASHTVFATRAGTLDSDTNLANTGVYLGYARGNSRLRDDYIINGGYTLDGTTTSAVADEVDVVTADPGGGSGLTSFKVQVCGYRNADDQAKLRTYCENLTAATPAQTLTTTQTFIEITVIKTNTYVGGISDETIAAAWDADATSILAAILQVDHPASDYTGGAIVLAQTNYWNPYCYDLAGCTVELGGSAADPNGSGPPYAQEGIPLVIVGATGTQAITFTDDSSQQLAGAASFVMNENDALQLFWAGKNAKWVELSRANN